MSERSERAGRAQRAERATARQEEPAAPLLREPADGVPDPLESADELAALIEAMAGAHGPVAVDAERASGYRYSQRAYLVQLRREGAGTALIDPIALPALNGLSNALGDAEWILHAANQDLACLAEVGMHPASLFDTELAGRLLGDERVALGTMVEQHLGVRLEKGHSAADWSTRPLPRDWLVYAALDVELLIAAPRCAGRRAARRRQGRMGAAGVRGRPAGTGGPAAHRPVAAHVRHPHAAQPPPARRGPLAVDRPRRVRRPA